MAFPARDKWQSPWEKNETEFDAETAATLIYNLSKEVDTKLTEAGEKLTEAQGKITEFEEKDLTEVERLRKQVERLQAKPPEPVQKTEGPSETDRLRVAMRKGLSEEDADRLRGTTVEELEADATKLAERLGISAGGDEGGDDGAGGTEYAGFESANGFTTGDGGLPSNRPRVRSDLGRGSTGGKGTFDPANEASLIGS
ncbi:MAG: hypothetical protein M3Q39_10030 [Actinomycetota bacterium]|nr:hypothetical protein [Actinomycetota bacterium]